MGKILFVFLCVLIAVVCVLSESPNPNSNATESENLDQVQLEEMTRELEKFHEEFKEFKSSLVELSAAFVHFHDQQSSIVNESTGETGSTENPDPSLPLITSCSDAMGILSSPRPKIQKVYPHGNNNKVEVLCDFETAGGGWTIIQQRSSGPQQEFNRTWDEYKNGFGSLDKNFWLGLENIRALTKNGDQELRIELENFEGETVYAKYSRFSISDASEFYRLSIGGFSGTVTDAIGHPSLHPDHRLNGMMFTTIDKDNDKDPNGNCATYFSGGWWFNYCTASHLNGLYKQNGEEDGISWYYWKNGTKYFKSLAKTEMKIRKRKSE